MRNHFNYRVTLLVIFLSLVLLPQKGEAEPKASQFIFDSVRIVAVAENDRAEMRPADYLEFQIIGHLKGEPSGQSKALFVKFREKDGPANGNLLLLRECLGFAKELQRTNGGTNANTLIINTKPDPRPHLFFYGPKSSVDQRARFQLITSCAYGEGFQ